MIRDHRNLDAIVHLAGKVGGIKDNTEKQAEYIYQNVKINTNVVHESYKENVPRLLSALSTCVFPDSLDSYPFRESDIFKGPPAVSNFSYGYAKRCLHVMSNAYRKQYGVNYNTFAPSNIYGPEDHFDDESSHFIPAAISKFHKASPGATVQQLYVDDLCRAIPNLLDEHNGDQPIIVAPDYNLSISSMVKMCKDIIGKDVSYSFNGLLDGQYRKDGSNARFKQMFSSFEFTPFEEGIRKTYEWYEEMVGARL